MNSEKTHIICIVGDGRCGSTVLDRVLGCHDDVVSCNELYRLFHRVTVEQGVCTCGSIFFECPFWSQVAAGVFDEASANRLAELQTKYDRTRWFFKLYHERIPTPDREPVEELVDVLAGLYAGIRRVSGSRIIVDSSKGPAHPLLLAKIPDVEISIVHLVRNPKAVMRSWRKQKFDPGYGGDMRQFSPPNVAATWVLRQYLGSALRKRFDYFRLTYEDFVASPRRTTGEIRDALPILSDKADPFQEANLILLPPLHSVSGNPDRFQHGPTKIRNRDNEPAGKDPLPIRLSAAAIWPYSRLFGY